MKYSGLNRGYGFVVYSTLDEAKECIKGRAEQPRDTEEAKVGRVQERRQLSCVRWR